MTQYKTGFIATLLLFSSMFLSCSHSYKNIGELNSWLNNPYNGCVISKSIKNITVTVKFLPTSYMVLKNISGMLNSELQTDIGMMTDSLINEQNHFLTFIMTIAPSKENNTDEPVSIMYDGLQQESEYAERVLNMNFFMEENLELNTDGNSDKPVAAFVENVYELSDSRNFVIMFANEKGNSKKNAKNYVFIFKDPYFNIGRLQFHFSGADFEKANKLKIPWSELK